MAATPGGFADGTADHGAPQLPELPEPSPDPDFEVFTPPGLDDDNLVPSLSTSDTSGQPENEVSPETTMFEVTSISNAAPGLPPGLPQPSTLPVQHQQHH